jgi:hypothetical protein
VLVSGRLVFADSLVLVCFLFLALFCFQLALFFLSLLFVSFARPVLGATRFNVGAH